MVFVGKDQSLLFLSTQFYNYADQPLREKVNKPVLEHIITHYWRKRKSEKKWHTFMRTFWENPDFNEPDLTAAFRKRSEKEKIKTRPKVKIHQEKLQKGEKAKEQTVKFVIMEILPQLFTREAQK